MDDMYFMLLNSDCQDQLWDYCLDNNIMMAANVSWSSWMSFPNRRSESGYLETKVATSGYLITGNVRLGKSFSNVEYIARNNYNLMSWCSRITLHSYSCRQSCSREGY